MLQSIGGGGGWTLFDEPAAYAILGAIAANGGSAGSIELSNTTQLISAGSNSPALVVQSIGGGGGATGKSKYGTQLGATGGSGNLQGGGISVDHTGLIGTIGDFSAGVLLQSIGGGGGLSDNVVDGGAILGARAVAGSDSNLNAGAVTLTVEGTIQTRGNNSPGLNVQSIAGGGGWIGNVNGELRLGSSEIAGSQNAGEITISSSAAINTIGDNSIGLLGQSIGGGGGVAGINTSLLSTQLGSNNSGSTNSGSLSLNNSGNVTTEGNNAAGIVVQSIAGGGGIAALQPLNGSSSSLKLGTVNGTTSQADAIAISNQASVITHGDAAPALLAQSIGGGGGAIQSLNNPRVDTLNLGSTSTQNSSAGSITLSNVGILSTSGQASPGLVLQAIGGGGGWSLLNSGTANLGAVGLTNGRGGDISLNLDGTVITAGNSSPALVAQSIGGGGGYAGSSEGDGILGSNDSRGALGVRGSIDYGSLSEPVASSPGVWLSIGGDLATVGDHAPVAVLQAIGGGGGWLGNSQGNARLGLSDSLNNRVEADGGSILVTSDPGSSYISTGVSSPGLVVQSVGGGGGASGIAGGSARLGSSGGTGSLMGGPITMTGWVWTSTSGDNSPTLVMQSIGGGGGLVADVEGTQLDLGTTSNGNTSAASVWIAGNIQLYSDGTNSPGLVAQSIGGGGGMAFTDTANVNLGSDTSGNSSSGDVSVYAWDGAIISTQGSSSPAVLAQSVGAGGGYAGGSGSGSVAQVSLGGSGQQSGGAGNVSVNLHNTSLLITTGTQSQGVIAQAIGGGGGFTSQNGAAMRLGMDGGTGSAGSVSIFNQGIIATSGSYSEGVLAQSIGGGGGSAGASTTNLVLGSSLGSTSNGGDVSVTNIDWISTSGDYSIGVFAQSVGGGGGRVGNASGDMTLGSNGGGGDGGNVSLNNGGGTIATAGAYSPAYLMQSIGGGGGMVGLGQSDGTGNVLLGGGVDGTAGSAGSLTLVNAGGTIQASGAFSPGVIHQSIGGGGGWIGNVTNGNLQLGGLTVGTSRGADLNLQMPFAVLTTGDNSPGAVLQSLGGGGGAAGNVSGNVQAGGTLRAGVDGRGGSPTYQQFGEPITTLGDNSPGVLLQSIGGGGGVVGQVNGDLTVGTDSAPGSNASGSAIAATTSARITTAGSSSPGLVLQSIGGGGVLAGSAPISVTAGSQGFGSSSAGPIELINRGAITTVGANSTAVILQSIGGGGVYTTSAGGGVITLGGSVVGDNDAGAISLRSSGAITTTDSNAAAIVAQSIGGGGGSVFGLEGAVASSIRLGSDTATQNRGSAIELTITGPLTSYGDLSPGVIAQSIGGGGGYAPLAATSASAGASNSVGLSAAAVSINLSADLTTAGNFSDAVIAQSIGGGGGVLGSTTTSLTLGATNGGQGQADDIAVVSSATIRTSGEQSVGITAQSIGAGGGRAGSASGSVTLGAAGGSGNAGNVSLNLAGANGDGSIITTGSQSPAFVLQSIGGGGGLVFPDSGNGNGDLLLGGSGLGSEGSGGGVSFTAGNRSRVVTTGDGSSGLTYQSIGGGGGYAGSTTASAQLGGTYRGSSRGADLTLSSQVAVSTVGSDASAMAVQTIGGGGGFVGSIGQNVTLGGTAALAGESNGSGGSIAVTVNSALMSSGDGAATVLAQSIGGGGGSTATVGGNATLGGLGQGQRRGGNLTLTLEQAIGSGGSHAAGLLGQSVGGGGGSVGVVNGNLQFGRLGDALNTGDSRAGDITLTLQPNAQLFSQGDFSPGLVLQSIGGGGGFAGGVSGSVQLGGGGLGTTGTASGGNIVWSNAGSISTSGQQSPGVVLQTIGGGGGYSTSGSSTNFSGAGHLGENTSSADLTITNTGVIATSGNNSFGMLAQSIGGGGGLSGASTGLVSLNNSNQNSASGNINLENSGLISTSGVGAHALVAQTIAGGGGFVYGGVRKEDSATLAGRPTGRSGDITVTNSGTIRTTGENAVALLFQDATGGAYLYQNPDGSVSAITEGSTDGVDPAGRVVVRNTGFILATGQGGVGITKSTSALSGNLRVDNAEGAVIQGGDGGTAINLPTDRVERVNNYGRIIGGSSGEGLAITGAGGPDEINNYGEIDGNISIPNITKNIYNAPTGRIEAQFVNLNGNVDLTNSGTVSPNGEYRIGRLEINANYITTTTSNYEADLVLRSGVTDQLIVQYAADLAGTVTLLANQVGQAKPGTFLSEGIITTADGIDLDKLRLSAPTSAVATFALQKVDSGRNLAFNYTVNYAPSGLNPNGAAVGQAVNQIQAAGSTAGFEPTAALIFAQQNISQLNTLYQQLSGATNTVFPQVTIDAAQGFQEDVLAMLKTTPINQSQRCLQQLQLLKPGEDFKGYPEDCGKWQGWFMAGGYNATTPGQGSSNQSGYNTAAFNSMAGADALVGPNTLVGAAARYDNLSTTTTPGQSAYGNTQGWSGLLYAKQRLGKSTWLTGLLGSGGFGTNITRQVSVQNPSTEQGTSQSTALGGALTLSQVIKTAEAGSLTPRIGISWMQLNQGSYNESTSSSNTAYQQPGNPLVSYPNPGKASYSLNYASAAYTSTPLEIGFDFKHPLKAGKMLFTPRLSVGYAWDLSNTSRNLTAQFQSAPTASFNVVGTPAPGSWWNLGLGFDLAINQRTSLYANTIGQLSPGSTQSINYSGGIRWRF